MGTPPGTARGAQGTPPTAGGGTGGKVSAVSGDTITHTTFNNLTVKVKVVPSTAYKDGTRTATSAALKTGDLAMENGSTSSDGTMTASTLTFGISLPGKPGN
jgi:hypothetical protein